MTEKCCNNCAYNPAGSCMHPDPSCGPEDHPSWEPVVPVRDPKARYYDAGGIEVLDVIRAKLTPRQYQGWLLGNIIKYSCRANFKDDAKRDTEKVAFYATELFGEL